MVFKDNVTKSLIVSYRDKYYYGRKPWCILDEIINTPEKHCQKCKLYHGYLSMTCEREYYLCIK